MAEDFGPDGLQKTSVKKRVVLDTHYLLHLQRVAINLIIKIHVNSLLKGHKVLSKQFGTKFWKIMNKDLVIKILQKLQRSPLKLIFKKFMCVNVTTATA